MGGDFREKVYLEEKDLLVSLGTYTEGNAFYNFRAMKRKDGNYIKMELGPSNGEKRVEFTYNQPKLSGAGENESLALSSQSPELPESDEDIEAYARLVLQPTDEEDFLDYSGDLEEFVP